MDLLALPESGVSIIVVGFGILILGSLVKYQGWTFLLAGHNPSNVTDEEAIADLAGGTLLGISLVIIVFGGLVATGFTPPILETVVTVVILIAVAQYVYRARTYAA
jgi:hypothetical protein